MTIECKKCGRPCESSSCVVCDTWPIGWPRRLLCKMGMHARLYDDKVDDKVVEQLRAADKSVTLARGWKCRWCPAKRDPIAWPEPGEPIDLSGLCDDDTPIILRSSSLPITEKKDHVWATNLVNDLETTCSHCGHAWAKHDPRKGCRMGNDNCRDGSYCTCPWLLKDPGCMVLDATKGGEVEFTLSKTDTIMLQLEDGNRVHMPAHQPAGETSIYQCECGHLWYCHTSSGCMVHPHNDYMFCSCVSPGSTTIVDAMKNARKEKEREPVKPTIELPVLKDLQVQVHGVIGQVNTIMDELKRLECKLDHVKEREDKRMRWYRPVIAGVSAFSFGAALSFAVALSFSAVGLMGSNTQPEDTPTKIVAPAEPTCEYCGTEDGILASDVVVRKCLGCESYHHCCDGDFRYSFVYMFDETGSKRSMLYACPKTKE